MTYCSQRITSIIIFIILAFSSIGTLAETQYQACSHKLQPDLTILSSGWSRDLSQQRNYTFSQSGLSIDDLRTLEVAWTFGFEDADQPRSLPAVTDQAVFIGSQEGAVFALDTNSGCGFWKFQTSASIRAAVTVAKVTQLNGDEIPVVFVANDDAKVYAIDAINGRKLWEKRVETHKHAVITGSPVYYAGNIFIPVSSKEVGIAVNPWGGCCTFRGSLVSLDAVSGKENWKTYTVTEPATFVKRNVLGGKQYGPAGAAIWSAPTIDTKRRLIYVGTGQDYSLPITDLSNAILAIDIETGRLVWKQKLWPKDAWNVACPLGIFGINCPSAENHDFDFGAPPIIATDVNGKDWVLAGAKSGIVYALDPDNQGQLVWKRKLGKGGLLGGVHWGMAADTRDLYVPVSDASVPLSGDVSSYTSKPGLNRLDLRTGELIWSSSASENCSDKEACKVHFSAAITGIPGAILAPGLNGILYAFSKEKGEVVWKFDSTVETQTVNGMTAHGGAMDAGGVVAANGMLFFNSGYAGPASAFGEGGNLFWVLKRSDPIEKGAVSTSPKD